MTIYRAGLLIIRAWIEESSGKPLRAHIRTTTNISKGFQSELTVADVSSASALVEKWLGEVLANGQKELLLDLAQLDALPRPPQESRDTMTEIVSLAEKDLLSHLLYSLKH